MSALYRSTGGDDVGNIRVPVGNEEYEQALSIERGVVRFCRTVVLRPSFQYGPRSTASVNVEYQVLLEEAQNFNIRKD